MNLSTRILALGCLIAFSSACSAVRADEPAKAAPPKSTAPTTHSEAQHDHPPTQVAYLGVGVEALHPAFWAHLKDLAERRYGVIIEEVGPGSPAEKAGLKAHDILMMYGDQKVYNPHQLHSLVHASKPGQHVNLQILRSGIPQEVMATLGEHTVAPRRETRVSPRAARQQTGWSAFDSMSIKKLGDDKYQVEINYRTKDEKIQHQTFEGTREEIRKDIQTRKDLPEDERADLLHALDMSTGDHPQMPDITITPDGKLIWDLNGFNAF